VASFAQSAPNRELMDFAALERRRAPAGVVVDIGCGAARNLLPIAQQGWRAVGIDSSRPMLVAASARVREDDEAGGRIVLAQGDMDVLPIRGQCADLIVAHGVWNLARSSDEFRRAVQEAARIARPAAGLFVFTFSRETLPPSAAPVAGESFVYTQFSGQPQCFLTRAELVAEMGGAGFEPEGAVPFREHNRPAGALTLHTAHPVIWEAAFRYRVR
jgi:SAM-dependent methyltransferase